MTTLRTSALLAALAGILTGCDLGALFVDDAPLAAGPATSVLQIPTLRAPAIKPVDKAAAAADRYPAVGEGLSRDPFLTDAEQTTMLTGHKVKEELVIAPVKKRTATKTAAKGKSLDWLEDADVNFIVFGQQADRRTAIIEGRLLQEGTVVGDYIVIAIGEEGVRLKERNGTGIRTKDFRVKAEKPLWE